MSDKAVSTYTVPKAIERKILKAIELKKQLEEQERSIKEELQTVMEEHGVYSIQSDNYIITLVTRSNYKATEIGKVPTDYLKQALDVTKVANFDKLYGKLPKGVEKSQIKFVTWRDRRGTKK